MPYNPSHSLTLIQLACRKWHAVHGNAMALFRIEALEVPTELLNELKGLLNFAASDCCPVTFEKAMKNSQVGLLHECAKKPRRRLFPKLVAQHLHDFSSALALP